MSKMKTLDLKKLFCPLEFKDFPPPLESPLCLFTYKVVITGFRNPFFTLPFPMPTPPCPCTPTQNRIPIVCLMLLPLQTFATSSKPGYAPQTIFSAHFLVRYNDEREFLSSGGTTSRRHLPRSLYHFVCIRDGDFCQ